MKARILLLDAGGTLFTEALTRDEIYARVLADHGLHRPLPAITRWREVTHAELPDGFGGLVRYTEDWFREFVRRLLVRLECDADPETVRRALAEHFSRPEHFVLYPDTLPALEELASRGVRLAVVSNWSDRLPALLDGLQLTRFFEVQIVSAIVGVTKPDRAIFRIALERLRATPDQALHVGDHPVNDLAGARRAGLSALLLDRDSSQADRQTTIRSLEELPGRLEG